MEKDPLEGKNVIDLNTHKKARENAKLRESFLGDEFVFNDEEEMTYEQIEKEWRSLLTSAPELCSVIKNEEVDATSMLTPSIDDLRIVLNNVRHCETIDSQCEYLAEQMRSAKSLIPYLHSFLP